MIILSSNDALIQSIKDTAETQSSLKLLALASLSYNNLFHESKITLIHTIDKIINTSKILFNFTSDDTLTLYRDVSAISILSKNPKKSYHIKNSYNLNIILTTSIIILNTPELKKLKNNNQAVYDNIQTATQSLFLTQ